MRRKVVHLHVARPGFFGGMASGSLCSKEQWQGGSGEDGGGMNFTDDKSEVTCKLCIRKMKRS